MNIKLSVTLAMMLPAACFSTSGERSKNLRIKLIHATLHPGLPDEACLKPRRMRGRTYPASLQDSDSHVDDGLCARSGKLLDDDCQQ